MSFINTQCLISYWNKSLLYELLTRTLLNCTYIKMCSENKNFLWNETYIFGPEHVDHTVNQKSLSVMGKCILNNSKGVYRFTSNSCKYVKWFKIWLRSWWKRGWLKLLNCCISIFLIGLPRWLSGKKSICQCRRCKRFRRDPLEEEMVTCFNFLARKIQWPEEPGGLQLMGLPRVGHNWVTECNILSFWLVSL